jgi:DNA primase
LAKSFGSLPPNFLDELRARTPLVALIGRNVRLTRSGREQKGCCPFHGEKTPSFYVYDDHFHCFGCGEHGDAITYVMKSTGAGFMEAVEQLASEAGLEVPKASPAQAEAEQKRAGIAEVLEAAAQLYQAWLFAPEGAAGLAYLRGRGLSDATIRKFGLGWSGEGRGALAAALRGQGITTEQLVEAGLMKLGDRGPVDMFFSRVMFPITDRRGQKISFGGRILGDGQPKYVNGPETAAFSKRRSLYGLNFAREAVRGGQPLIVVEGYMDVIALAQAGFGGAVAPLGTALTEDHLAEIWRLSPEPVICFDADAAGRRAALRTVDLALTALAPDRSLKFLRLPEKDDPDSIIRREGPVGFKARLDKAEGLSSALYDMLADGIVATTPEARADFRRRLMETANRIPDKILAGEYRSMLLDRFFAARRRASPLPGAKLLPYSSRVNIRANPQIAPDKADQIRAFIMTATLLAHPALYPEVEEAFAHVKLPPSCARLRDGLNHYVAAADTLDTETLFTHLSGLGLAEEAGLVVAVSAEHYRPDPQESPGSVAQTWFSWHPFMTSSLTLLREQRDLQAEHWKARRDTPDEGEAWARLVKYNELVRRAETGEYGLES